MISLINYQSSSSSSGAKPSQAATSNDKGALKLLADAAQMELKLLTKLLQAVSTIPGVVMPELTFGLPTPSSTTVTGAPDNTPMGLPTAGILPVTGIPSPLPITSQDLVTVPENIPNNMSLATQQLLVSDSYGL